MRKLPVLSEAGSEDFIDCHKQQSSHYSCWRANSTFNDPGEISIHMLPLEPARQLDWGGGVGAGLLGSFIISWREEVSRG